MKMKSNLSLFNSNHSFTWLVLVFFSMSSVSSCPLAAIFYIQTGDISNLPLLCHYPVKVHDVTKTSYLSYWKYYWRCKMKVTKTKSTRIWKRISKCLISIKIAGTVCEQWSWLPQLQETGMQEVWEWQMCSGHLRRLVNISCYQHQNRHWVCVLRWWIPNPLHFD